MPSASSTARTEVSAWVPVQTPQIRSVKAQASRGSRSFRITSMPRHIVPVDTALRITLFSSTLTSTRRWPSMRVTGSTTTRVPELSSVKPFGVWIGHDDASLPLPIAVDASFLSSALLSCARFDRGDGGMRGDRAADRPGRRGADLVGIGLDAELAGSWSAGRRTRPCPRSRLPSSRCSRGRTGSGRRRRRSSARSSRRCRWSGPCSPSCRGNSPCARASSSHSSTNWPASKCGRR